MEMESAKVLDNGRRIVVDMKRKRTPRCMAYFSGAACRDARCAGQDALPEVYHKQKDSRMGSDGCKNNSGLSINYSVPKNYSNFMRSGLPQRVLYYENEEWTDFPEGFIGLVKEGFRMKKVVTEVEFRGSPSLLDFLRMIVVDLKTGLQQPIAWIDELGVCFFPETYHTTDELHECFQSGGRENHSLLYSQPNESQEIKLQLEIEITADGGLKIEGCSEGSNSHAKRLKVDGIAKPVENNGLDQEASTDMKPVLGMKEVMDENMPMEVQANNVIFRSSSRKLTSDVVKQIFVEGMGLPVCADDIRAIQHSSGYWAQARLELFEKQVEITGKYRGNANVQYAWLGSSKDAASRILMHGLGCNDLPKTSPAFGNGIHLTALGCSRISASYCDIDENGVQHMVLCRVILGNLELVRPGSEQCYPSNENFDSGVNDLSNPDHYIVWNTNMSTHIYPEYYVSFRAPSSAKGYSSESGSKDVVSAVTDSIACQEKRQLNSSHIDSVAVGHQPHDNVEIPQGKNSTVKCAGRPPKSAWMPFSMLFAAIEDKVPYNTMKLVYQYYGEFKDNKISRDELVQRMRWAVGDTLLRATIINLQTKQGNRELKSPKQEQHAPFINLQLGNCELKSPKQEQGTSF